VGATSTSVRNKVRQLRHKLSRMMGKAHLRELNNNPDLSTGSATAARINELLKLNLGISYLEIGVAHGETLESVRAERRTGVDPSPVFALDRLPRGLSFHSVTSDQFFARLDQRVSFDAVLLDGLHEFTQTYRDLLNALKHLGPRGFILIDDTVPADAASAIPSQKEAVRVAIASNLPFPRPWMGDVYKVVQTLSIAHPDLEYYTYVGSGRHQTVVWRKLRHKPLDTESLLGESSSPMEFDQTWTQSLPEWFHAATDEQIQKAFEQFIAR
jgi:hypothetical protein